MEKVGVENSLKVVISHLLMGEGAQNCNSRAWGTGTAARSACKLFCQTSKFLPVMHVGPPQAESCTSIGDGAAEASFGGREGLGCTGLV